MTQQLAFGEELEETAGTEPTDPSAYDCPTMGCDGKLRHIGMAEPSYHCRQCDHEWLTQTVEVYNND